MMRFGDLPRHAVIQRGADVHPTAVIGEPPESRVWWARDRQSATDSYGAYFDAVIGSTARVGPFSVVDGGLDHNTVVNGWCFRHVGVGHDARVEEGAEVSSGALIGGHCRVGFRARIGIGAVLLPFVKVGDDAIVGAGAVVTKDVPGGQVWAGVPARFRKWSDGFEPVVESIGYGASEVEQRQRARLMFSSPRFPAVADIVEYVEAGKLVAARERAADAYVASVFTVPDGEPQPWGDVA